jgi:hypothetical protein
MTSKRTGKTPKQSTPKRGTQKPIAKAANTKKSSADNGQAEAAIVESRPPSLLRGLLPTPPEVEERVAQVLKGRPVSNAARQRIIDDFEMDYYFGGY